MLADDRQDYETWREAEERCMELGGQLASFPTKHIADRFMEIVQNVSVTNRVPIHYIGLKVK